MADKIVSGIYKIENLVNGKCYIGSSVNIEKRWSVHVAALKKQRHHSKRLQSSWDKHGRDMFCFSILELVECLDLLIVREQFWIDRKSPWYNIAKVAGSCLGVVASDEKKLKISRAAKSRKYAPLSEAHKNKISTALTGFKRPPASEAVRKQRSLAQTGKTPSKESIEKTAAFNRGKPRTDEVRLKISIGSMGKKMPQEAVEKTAAKNRGRALSVEHRKKISASLKAALSKKKEQTQQAA